MPSTYSPDLRIELIANGEQSGTWGSTTNNNLGTLIEDAISGLASVTVTSSNQALTALNGAADEARCAALNLTTTTGAPFNVYVPPVTKIYIVNNASAYAASIYASTALGNTTPAGSGVSIPAGKSALIRCTGVDVVDGITAVPDSFSIGSNLSVGGNLTVAGTTTLSGNPTLALQAATKQYVDSAVAGGVPSGCILMWSGSIASIPSGWYLCNGSNGTPDLRDRFVVGAGSTYAVGATGGSANAIVVAHTHTGTTSSSGTHDHESSVAVQRVQVGTDNGTAYAGYSTGTNFFPTTTTPVASNGAHTHTFTTASSGSSGTNANLPPYYALCYIMKA